MTMQHRFLAAAAAALLFSACGQSGSPSLPSGVAAPASGAPALARSLPAAQPLMSAQHGRIAVSQRWLNALPPREASELRRALAAIPHAGGGDYVIAIPGINGVEAQTGFVKWNPLESFAVAGAPANPTLTFTRRADTTTPPLLTDLFSGQTFTGADPPGVAGKNVTELAIVQEVNGKGQAAVTLTFGKPIATGFTSAFGDEDVQETWTIQFQTLKLCVGTTCNTTDLRG